jgi:hypothetical protein
MIVSGGKAAEECGQRDKSVDCRQPSYLFLPPCPLCLRGSMLFTRATQLIHTFIIHKRTHPSSGWHSFLARFPRIPNIATRPNWKLSRQDHSACDGEEHHKSAPQQPLTKTRSIAAVCHCLRANPRTMKAWLATLSSSADADIRAERSHHPQHCFRAWQACDHIESTHARKWHTAFVG